MVTQKQAISPSIYVSLTDIIDFLPASRSTVTNWIRRGDFPEALPLPSRRRLWYRDEINAWLKNHALPSLPAHTSDMETV